jgi:hypothetical protein
LADEYEAAKLRWAGGAERPVWRCNAPKKTGARSARARTQGQNLLVMYIHLLMEVCCCAAIVTFCQIKPAQIPPEIIGIEYARDTNDTVKQE